MVGFFISSTSPGVRFQMLFGKIHLQLQDLVDVVWQKPSAVLKIR
jgi:hypothetical protein